MLEAGAAASSARSMSQLPSEDSIRDLLARCSGDDAAAAERITPLIYAELKTLAARALRGERAGHTLQTTALVNEACLRLLGQRSVDPANRAQLVALAAQAMRRVLVDYARMRQADKRPPPDQRLLIDEIDLPAAEADLVGLDAALERLATLSPRQARVVDLKFFAGLELEEIAQVLAIARPTVVRDWRMARAWLQRELA
jgi:RNA polymerase sigma-70 factor, ECF subfamily